MTSLRDTAKSLIPADWRAALVGLIGGSRMLRGLLANSADIAVIEAELADLPTEGWRTFRAGRPTRFTTERVVEIPWALSRYRGERRVLDVGTGFAHPVYTAHLTRLGIPELHGVDLTLRRAPGMRMMRADVRRMPYRDGFFDLVICVSTIEHIGRDNRRYGIGALPSSDGDLAALVEMRRVLHAEGRLLVTVPFGRREDLGWFVQYDRRAWHALLDRAEMREVEVSYYAYEDDGWASCDDPSGLEDRSYGHAGAAGASAVLCAVLVR